ncbi:MAG: hypothetical protein HGA38_04250 [Candidatus Moranbacteria bacterium]|nr:hypothetical protein [Candidatus Moranbacteria bacterium]NTW45825.1 hypothetical protein [Candidatus Moranbacteria bacterium]
MKFQQLLLGVRFFTVLSLLAWVCVLLFVDPDVTGAPGAALFLGTLFSGLTGSFTLALVAFARRFLGDAGASASFHMLFRQGFILSAYGIILLGLSRAGMLAWWNAGLVLAAALLLEFTARRLAERKR